MMDVLNVSEVFPSIQGEGCTAGRPAVFMRLQGCMLSCTWCDTTEVWRKGKPWKQKDFSEWFESLVPLWRKGFHFVLTGGEPMLQQAVFTRFFASACSSCMCYPTLEVETSGRVLPSAEFRDLMINRKSQWNLSPKFSDSGPPANGVYFSENMIRYVVSLEDQIPFQLKFVVRSENQIVQQILPFVDKFDVPLSRVWLMPESSTREEFLVRGAMIAELAYRNGFNFSPRLQLVLWDRATGV